MRRALRIARREYVATVCTRGFILGLILVPLMMGGGLIGVVARAVVWLRGCSQLAVGDGASGQERSVGCVPSALPQPKGLQLIEQTFHLRRILASLKR